VRALAEKDSLAPGDLLVVYDDIDLTQGRIRLRPGGSSGGHNGIKSIQQALQQAQRGRRDMMTAADESPPSLEFPRLKVGLGRPPPGVDPVDYVLTTFKPDELLVVQPAIERAADAIECWLDEGIEVAMNRFNAPPAAPSAAPTSSEPQTATSGPSVPATASAR
jgi:PTH1 family peptidyl-tRNA hydrolase